MSKPIDKFFTMANRSFDVAAKLKAPREAGTHILPSKTTKNDADYELRIDAGETIGGRRNVVLQVNSQAKSTALQEWVRKNTSHAKLATATYDTSAKDPDAEAIRVMKELQQKAKSNI